jgi:hypothetical protein
MFDDASAEGNASIFNYRAVNKGLLYLDCYASPERRELFTSLHRVTSQKSWLFIAAVLDSKPRK